MGRGFALSRLLRLLKLTRQGMAKWRGSVQRAGKLKGEVAALLAAHREDHRRDGSRQSYYGAQAKEKLGVGVTKFERMASELGLTIKPKRRWVRTSDRCSRSSQYKNLTNGLVLNGPGQLIVADLFYFTGPKRYYVFVLTDVYLGKLAGLSGGRRMTAEVALVALDQFFEWRGEGEHPRTIHHSDGGSQYFSDIYLERLKRAKIQVSVAASCQENGHAEQKNDTVKNRYLRFLDTSTDAAFEQSLKKVKQLVNEARVMKSKGWKTPVAFEAMVATMDEASRPKITLHDFTQTRP